MFENNILKISEEGIYNLEFETQNRIKILKKVIVEKNLLDSTESRVINAIATVIVIVVISLIIVIPIIAIILIVYFIKLKKRKDKLNKTNKNK